MAHPAFGAEPTTTSTLLAAFTVLDPGERARPHRHTGAAIRFATRSEGAVTIVNGRRCEMKAGDLILTPPMVWHGHINESDHRIIWFDAANMPLIRAVDAHFFEPGDPRNNEFWQVDQGEEALWTEAGLRAEGATASAANSPKYRYPGEATRRLLDASPAGADGMRAIRYVNPATGGAVGPGGEADRRAGVPVRAGAVARLQHREGGEQGAGGGGFRAEGRMRHDQRAPLDVVDRHLADRTVQKRLDVAPAPDERRIARLRLDRGDLLVAVPERMQVLRLELGDEGTSMFRDRSVSHRLSPFAPPAPLSCPRKRASSKHGACARCEEVPHSSFSGYWIARLRGR